jgi:hypothetical protein
MMRFYLLFALLIVLKTSLSLSLSANVDRRAALGYMIGATPLVMSPFASLATAGADCFSDCMKSCKAIAPKDTAYCTENCNAYCEQDDRTDGLSGR